jgi:hypothetical protein
MQDIFIGIKNDALYIDLSLFGPAGFESGSKKISVISGRKNPAHDHLTGRVGPQFSGRARAGPGLGRAARTFYSVKQLKTAFRAGLGPKKFFAGFKISAHARPVRLMGGPGAGRASGPGRAGLKMLRYTYIHKIITREKKEKLALTPRYILCRESQALPRVRLFAQSQIKNSRQRRLCQEPIKKLSAKKKHSPKRLLCQEPTKKLSAKKNTLDKDFFAECQLAGFRQRISLPSAIFLLSAK